MIKNKILILACTMLVAGLSGCTGTDQTVAPAVASNTVAGSAVKGPYQVGSTVKVYKLTNGVRGADPVAEGTVTDALGTYSVDIPSSETGPFELVVLGSYVDETTGALSTTDQETSLVIADAANVPAKLSVNPIASIQAELVKKALIANNGADVAATIQSSGTLALESMGIPTVDASGNAVDPAQLDMFDTTADPAVVAAFLTASAVIADVVNKGNGTVADFATNAATDVAAGNAVGTAGGTTAAINTAATNVATIDLVANIASGVSSQGGTATVAATAAQVTTATTAAATLTTLKGFVLNGNALTIGGVSATVAATGVASTVTGVPATGVTIAMTVKDLGTGTAPKATSASSSFDFWVKDTATTRMIKGQINPVSLVADGAGTVTFTVPANATLTWSGVTAAGTALNGTATNLALNTIFATNNAGLTTINLNGLLTQLQAKIGNADLNVLNIAGTFDYAAGFGVNIGWANATNNGIMNLFPTGNANVTGRAISGTITTQ
ncbi:hypothetical protein JYT78_00175 [bacterium AH-315-I20]|nr:hypothetical protein [bacterium AH-315-I20]